MLPKVLNPVFIAIVFFVSAIKSESCLLNANNCLKSLKRSIAQSPDHKIIDHSINQFYKHRVLPPSTGKLIPVI